MSHWSNFFDEVHTYLDMLKPHCDMPFFRGHSNSDWKLLPGLGRKVVGGNIESIIYYDYLSFGGGLLGSRPDSWDVLFAMQHHGMPTRLLDWSTTFAAALYFAIKPFIVGGHEMKTNPCVWILNPYDMGVSKHSDGIVNPYIDLKGSYFEYFVDQKSVFKDDVIPLAPPQHTPRQSAQRSVFTLHKDVDAPLEDLLPQSLKKFEIPVNGLDDAKKFLDLAGVNEFTIFPDLDGLSRYLCMRDGLNKNKD